MYPHRINLRDPWTTIRHEQRIAHRRVFHWRTELMPFEKLWLVVSGAETPIQVTLNQLEIGRQPLARVPLEIDITPLVEAQNVLEVSSQLDAAKGLDSGTIGAVFLEVRRSVHFSSILGNCRWNKGKPFFEMTARVAGQPDRKLSVVIRLNDQEIHYEEFAMVAVVPVIVTTRTIDVPPWIPGQSNPLQNLEIQLLDPACVLSQHHYETGFLDIITETNQPVEELPGKEPILESAWLREADQQGRLVRVRDVPLAVRMQHLWHHPCLKHQC